MAQNTFSMVPEKQGRLKYVVLTMAPTILLLCLFLLLTETGILPVTKFLSQFYVYFPFLLVLPLEYLLIFKKNHTINIQNKTIFETSWNKKKKQTFKVTQFHSFRRNLLGEIIILDETGRKLLCVEANMSNFDLFQHWLEHHDIKESKEK